MNLTKNKHYYIRVVPGRQQEVLDTFEDMGYNIPDELRKQDADTNTVYFTSESSGQIHSFNLFDPDVDCDLVYMVTKYYDELKLLPEGISIKHHKPTIKPIKSGDIVLTNNGVNDRWIPDMFLYKVSHKAYYPYVCAGRCAHTIRPMYDNCEYITQLNYME
jgi:hypothetical protein